MDDKRNELLQESIIKLLFKLSLPAIFGMLVIGLYSFVDAIFVGQWVGENALGAISIAYPFTLINNGIAVLVGIGSASVLSRAIGRRDQSTVDRIMGNLFMMVLLLSTIVMVVGIIFARNLLSLSGVEGEMLDMGVSYLRIIYIGSFFVNFAQSANMVIRGEGKMGTAMIIMGLGAVLNMILDPIFIKVLGYGIEGAAIATIISQFVQAIITFIYFYRSSPLVRFHGYRLDRALIPEVASIGVSAMLMQVMSLVQQTVLYSVLSSVGGQEKVVVMGALMRYMMLSFIPIWGISQGFQPMAGTNYGAGAYDRVKKATWIFGAGAVGLGVIFWVPFMLVPDTILHWFIKGEAIVSSGVTDTLLAYSIFPIAGFLIVLLTLFQSVGDAKKAGLFVMLRQVFLFIPLVYILPHIGGLGATGAFLSFPITDLLVLILATGAMYKLFRSLDSSPTQPVEETIE